MTFAQTQTQYTFLIKLSGLLCAKYSINGRPPDYFLIERTAVAPIIKQIPTDSIYFDSQAMNRDGITYITCRRRRRFEGKEMAHALIVYR